PRTICGLRESEVTWKCTYSNIHIVRHAFWFSFKQKAKWKNEEHPEDLNSDPDYTGRLNPKILRSSLSLTIRDLRETDSGEYHVLIITARGQELRSSTAVHLTVTGVDESCWNVAYTERELCALEGSSVDFHCTYAPPSNQTVTGVFWYYEQLKDLFS
ncbi:hypothetical protein NFI96_029097, partial [Prochilodus magdalenae]